MLWSEYDISCHVLRKRAKKELKVEMYVYFMNNESCKLNFERINKKLIFVFTLKLKHVKYLKKMIKIRSNLNIDKL